MGCDELAGARAANAQAWAYPSFQPPAITTREFNFGIAALHERLGATMGVPLECEHINPDNGDTIQHTSTGLAYYLWNLAVRRVGPSQTAAFSNLVPFVALVAAFLLLREPITLPQLLGGVLIVSGLVVMRRGRGALNGGR